MIAPALVLFQGKWKIGWIFRLTTLPVLVKYAERFLLHISSPAFLSSFSNTPPAEVQKHIWLIVSW